MKPKKSKFEIKHSEKLHIDKCLVKDSRCYENTKSVWWPIFKFAQAGIQFPIFAVASI